MISPPTTYDADQFYEGLLEHRLIVSGGVPGVFGRGAVFEDVLERFNGLISELSRDDGADFYTFPPVIDRTILERVHYLNSFPHLCGAVHSFFGNALQALALAERAQADLRRFRRYRSALPQAVPHRAGRCVERQHDPAGGIP